MADRTVLIKAQFEDQATAPAAALNAALKQTEDQLKALEQQAQSQQSALSSLGSGLTDTSGLADRLATSLRDLVASGESLDSAVNQTVDSFSSLYNEGYTAGEAIDALDAAAQQVASELEQAAAAAEQAASADQQLASAAEGAAQSNQQLAGASNQVGQQHQQTSQHTDNLSKSTIDLSKAVQGASGGFQGMLSTLGSLAPEMAAVATAGALVAKVTSDFIVAAGSEEVEIARLNAVLRANVPNWQAYTGAIDKAIEKAQRLGFSDGDVRQSLTRTLPTTMSVTTSLKQLDVAYGMAALGGTSLSQAAFDLTRAIDTGQVRSLRGYNIVLDSSIDKSQILAEVQKRVGTVAEDVSNTTAGSASRTKVAFDNMAESVGSNLLGQTKEGAGGLEALAVSVDSLAGKGTFLGGVISGMADLFTEPVRHIAKDMDDLGDALGGSADKAQETADSISTSAQDSADAVGQSWGVDVPAAFEQGVGGVSEQVDGLAQFLAERGAQMVVTGDATGDGYARQLILEMVAKYPAAVAAVGGVEKILDIVASSKQAGSNVGSGFGGAVVSGVAANKAALQSQINAYISILNAAITGVNALAAATGGKQYPLIGTGGGGSVSSSWGDSTDASDRAYRGTTGGKAGLNPDARGSQFQKDMDAQIAALNANDPYAGIEGIKNSPSRSNTMTYGGESGTDKSMPSLRQQAENLQKLYQQFVDQYGVDPATGEIVDPEKAKGGKGKKKGKGSGGADTADKMAQAKADLEEAAQRYQAALKQAELEDTVKKATDTTTAAREKAKAVAEGYKEALDFANQALDNNDKAEEKATAGIKGRIAAEEAAIASMRANNSADLHDLDVSIHNTTGVLQELEREAASAQKQFQDAVTAAQKAQAALQTEIAAAGEAFQDRKDALADEARAYEQTAKVLIGPYDQALKEASAAVAAQQEHVTALQDALSALTDQYENKLLPIERELKQIQQTSEHEDRARQIETQAQAVANLSARLATAVPGSQRYNQLQRELADAEKQLGRGQRVDELTRQKEAIEAERDAAVKAKQDEIKAEEQKLKQLQATQKAAQEARDQEAALIEQQRAAIAERMAAVEREQELYNREARDRQAAAQQAVTDAQADLAAQQERDRQRQESTRLLLESQQTERSERAWTAQEAEYAEQRKLTALQNYLAQSEAPFKEEKIRLQGVRDDIKDQADAQKILNDANVEAAQNAEKSAKAQLDLFRDNEKAAKIQQDWADAQSKYADTVDKLSKAKQPLQDIHTAQVNAATSGKAYADVIKNDVAPAAQGLSTTTHDYLEAIYQEWELYFGTTGDKGKIRQLLFAKNEKGFHQYLEDHTALALGLAGYRGKWEQGLQQTFNAIDEKFTENKPALVLAGTNAADAIADAFIAEANSRFDKMTFSVSIAYGGGSGPGGGGGGGSTSSMYAPSGYGSSMYAPAGNTNIGSQVNNFNFPSTMTNFPKTREEWYSVMQAFDEGQRMYNGMKGKTTGGQPRVPFR